MKKIKHPIEVEIEHEGNPLVVYPYGPDSFANGQKNIHKDSLRPATICETISIVDYLVKEEEHPARVRMDGFWGKFSGSHLTFYGDTGTHFVLGKGIYIQDHPILNGETPTMTESDLATKLNNNDLNVRFIPQRAIQFDEGTRYPHFLKSSHQIAFGIDATRKIETMSGSSHGLIGGSFDILVLIENGKTGISRLEYRQKPQEGFYGEGCPFSYRTNHFLLDMGHSGFRRGKVQEKAYMFGVKENS